MKNLAKAGICALALTAAFSFAGAESVTQHYDSAENGYSDEGTIKIGVDDLIADGATSVTITFDFSNGSWGGGCVGYNATAADGKASWTSPEWKNEGTTEVTVNVADLWVNEEDPTDVQSIQIQNWWGSVDPTIGIDVVITYPDAPVATEVGEEITADNNYSISSEDYGAASSADLDLYFSKDVWNDWCQGLIVVEADDVTTYYLLKGAQANWNLTIAEDEDGNKTVVPSATDATIAKDETAVENFVIVDIAGAGQEQTVSVDLANAENWKITFYSPAWNNGDGTAEDIDGTSQDLSGYAENYVYGVNKITVNPADASSEPSVETPSTNDSVATPSDADAADDNNADNNADNSSNDGSISDNNNTDGNTAGAGTSTTSSPKTGDATPVAAMAILAVVSLAGVVITKKARG
jgi:hypothetical protein